ncbi:MAG: hypothetical protein II062_03075 [Oscillospiraceae bacterium]|nr:hypothetical protein [Oscillospiraceae bacterium]
MTIEEQNAYQILGVSETASPEEIRDAYEKLEERYSETNYLGSPLWDMAAEKRELIRAAYALLSGDKTGAGETESPAEGLNTESPEAAAAEQDSVSVRVRRLLNRNEPNEAEALLKEQPDLETNPEYVYLRGMAAWKKGWLDEATSYVEKAVQMAPKNQEYRHSCETIKTGSPASEKLKQAAKDKKKTCGACGACAGECLCEALCESICESISC